jgi:outer membrane receptor protein involved in Fe transport
MRITQSAAAALLLPLAACYDLQASAQAGYAQLALDGDVGYVSGSSTASIEQDIESALGLGEDQGSPYARAQVDFGVPVLTASGFTFDEEGTGTLTVNFGAVPAGTDVLSDFSMANAKASLAFDIPIGPVTLAPGLAVDWFDLSITVRDTIGFASEDVDIQAPLPLGFLRGQVDLGPVIAVAEVGFLDAEIDDVDGQLLDIEAQLQVRPTDWLDLFVGYRRIDMDARGLVDNDTVDIDLSLSGFLVGGGVRF